MSLQLHARNLARPILAPRTWSPAKSPKTGLVVLFLEGSKQVSFSLRPVKGLRKTVLTCVPAARSYKELKKYQTSTLQIALEAYGSL